MGRLDGKVALISGGARGQGAAEAQLCAREGAKVVFGDLLDAEGRQVEGSIRAAGGEATYVHLDVTNEASWRAAVETAVSRYGALHVLVNNAGMYIRKRIEETTEDDLDQILAVNVKGVFLGVKHALPAMRRAGGGSIINISSVAGLVGNPNGSPIYTTSRARCGSLPRPRQCSMPGRIFAVIPSILAPSIRPCWTKPPKPVGSDARACPAQPRRDGEGYRLRRAVSGLG